MTMELIKNGDRLLGYVWIKLSINIRKVEKNESYK